MLPAELIALAISMSRLRYESSRCVVSGAADLVAIAREDMRPHPANQASERGQAGEVRPTVARDSARSRASRRASFASSVEIVIRTAGALRSR